MMMVGLKEKLEGFVRRRWPVFVAAIWIQSCTGSGYLFGSISPVMKASLNYNQKQVSVLGVVKNLGGAIGFLAGNLSEILPLWGVLLIGALQNIIGYGWVWLIVTSKLPVLPLWSICALIFVGHNGETYFNTSVLVSCVQNFPKSRGPVVGMLKGFAALSGAILTQIYTTINFPDQASIIFMVAVGPTMVVIALMFIIRPVGGDKQLRPSDSVRFTFIYSLCLLLAAYLMSIMLLEDLVNISHNLVTVFTVILFFLLFVPILLCFHQEPTDLAEEVLLPKHEKQEVGVFDEVEDEKPKEVDLPEGARRGPRRGEDFTFMQALMNADLWVIMFSMLLGSGSGITVIDNLGQMSQSLGYDNNHIFVSMISIWNFLGRVGGGYVSEIVVRDYAYPRPIVIAMAQLLMAVGHVFFAMGWPGAMYIGTLLVGLCYGAHWAIMPATSSELFGLKKFGALYNFLNLANPVGTLVFSSVIASSIYDREAEKQAHQLNMQPHVSSSVFSGLLAADEPLECQGSICFFLSSMIMSGFCIIAAVLSMILVHRTRTFYDHLHGKSHPISRIRSN